MSIQQHSPADGRPRMSVKVYLVCQFLNIAKPGEPNARVIAAKLTRQAAVAIVDRTPGTFIEKVFADK